MSVERIRYRVSNDNGFVRSFDRPGEALALYLERTDSDGSRNVRAHWSDLVEALKQGEAFEAFDSLGAERYDAARHEYVGSKRTCGQCGMNFNAPVHLPAAPPAPLVWVVEQVKHTVTAL